MVQESLSLQETKNISVVEARKFYSDRCAVKKKSEGIKIAVVIFGPPVWYTTRER